MRKTFLAVVILGGLLGAAGAWADGGSYVGQLKFDPNVWDGSKYKFTIMANGQNLFPEGDPCIDFSKTPASDLVLPLKISNPQASTTITFQWSKVTSCPELPGAAETKKAVPKKTSGSRGNSPVGMSWNGAKTLCFGDYQQGMPSKTLTLEDTSGSNCLPPVSQNYPNAGIWYGNNDEYPTCGTLKSQGCAQGRS